MFITVIYVVPGYLLGGIIQSSTINLFAQKNTLLNVAVLDWVTQTIVPCFTTLHHDSFFQNENIGRPSTSAYEKKRLTSTRPSDGHKGAGKKNIFICG